MTSEMLIPLVSRWVHILAAIVTVGGSVFLRFVLMPAAASTLSHEEHDRLRTRVMKRWKMFVHSSIALLLLSGFYNYLAVTRFLHQDQPLYHVLFGVKFMLAILVFALAIGLTSRGELFAKLRENSRIWLAVLVALAVAVVLLGGVLKQLPPKEPEFSDVTKPTALPSIATAKRSAWAGGFHLYISTDPQLFECTAPFWARS